jgi:hypothetical protein
MNEKESEAEIRSLRADVNALIEDVALAKELRALRVELDLIRAAVVSEQLLAQRRSREVAAASAAAESSRPPTSTGALKAPAFTKAERSLVAQLQSGDAHTVASVSASSSEAAVEILNAMTANASVTGAHVLVVSMSACGAGRSVVDALVRWLQAARQSGPVALHTLDLESNRLTSDDMILLAGAVADLPRLQTVRLANQQRSTINPNARRAMLDAVHKSAAIAKISFDFSGSERMQIEQKLTANAREHARREANEKFAAKRATEAAKPKEEAPAAATATAAAAAAPDAAVDWRRRAEMAEALLKASEQQHALDQTAITSLRRELQSEQGALKTVRATADQLKRENESLARQLLDANQRASLAQHTIGELERKLERRAAAAAAAGGVAGRGAEVARHSDDSERIERLVAQQRAREEQQRARDAEAAAAERARADAARLAAIEQVRAAPSSNPAPKIEADNRAAWRKTSDGGWEEPEVGPVALLSAHSNSNAHKYLSPVTATALPLVWLDMLRFRDALTTDAAFVPGCQVLAQLVAQYAATGAKRTVDRMIKLVKLAAAVAHRSVWISLPDAHDDDGDGEPEAFASANLGLELPILSRSVLRETFTLLSDVERSLREAAHESNLGTLSPLMAAASFESVVRAQSSQLLRDAERVANWRRSLEAVWTANLRSCLDWGDVPIPRLVLETIFSNLESVDDMLQCRVVSHAWRDALHDNSFLWRDMAARLHRWRAGRDAPLQLRNPRPTSSNPRLRAVALWRAIGESSSSLAYCRACGQFLWAVGSGRLAVQANEILPAANNWFYTGRRDDGACAHFRLALIPPNKIAVALMDPHKL